MKKRNDKIDYHVEDTFDQSTSSATDMTGLIPSLPEDDAESDAYRDLYPYMPRETPEDRTF